MSDIILWPDPRLSEVCAPVTAFDDDLCRLVTRMRALVVEHHAAGLAAPQLGVMLRVFVVSETILMEATTYVNPTILTSGELEVAEEGCLSLPGVSVKVRRARSALVTAYDVCGESFTETAYGYAARVWQHEMDHLGGKLIIDGMSEAEKAWNRRELRDLRRKWANK